MIRGIFGEEAVKIAESDTTPGVILAYVPGLTKQGDGETLIGRGLTEEIAHNHLARMFVGYSSDAGTGLKYTDPETGELFKVGREPTQRDRASGRRVLNPIPQFPI